MRMLLVSAFALGALSSVALAEPAKLTDAELDSVTAAGFAIAVVSPTAAFGFERTMIPPLVRGIDTFVPASGIVVVGDVDGVSVLGSARPIGFATPTLHTFGAPFALIIVNQNVVLSATAP